MGGSRYFQLKLFSGNTNLFYDCTKTNTGLFVFFNEGVWVNFCKGIRQITLYSRNKEVCASVLHKIVKREERLFINNTGLCKGEIFSIKFETCPLLVTKNTKFFAFF